MVCLCVSCKRQFGSLLLPPLLSWMFHTGLAPIRGSFLCSSQHSADERDLSSFMGEEIGSPGNRSICPVLMVYDLSPDDLDRNASILQARRGLLYSPEIDQSVCGNAFHVFLSGMNNPMKVQVYFTSGSEFSLMALCCHFALRSS